MATPDATPDDARTDSTTDADADPVAAVAAARATLEEIDADAVDDATESRLVNAIEPLDNILLNVSPGDLATAAASGPREDDAPSSGERPAYADPFPDHYNRSDYDTDAALLDALTFDRGETVAQLVEFDSAVWACIARAAGDDTPAAEWIRRHAWSAACARQDAATHAPDLEIDGETWEEIALYAAALHQLGTPASEAFADAENQFLETRPQLVVDGEPKGLEDVPGVDADTDAD